MKSSNSLPISSGKNLLLLALISLVVAPIVACDDDSFVSGDDPEFFADPDPVVLDSVDIGESTTDVLWIENTGSGDLNVSDIELHNEEGNYLSPANDWDDATIEPDDYIDLQIEYAPQSEGNHYGYVEMSTNDEDNNPARVDIETRGFEPEIHVSPREIPFQAGPGYLDERYTEIQNIGDGTLNIDDIFISENPNGDYSISFFDELEPGGELPDRDDDFSTVPDTLEVGESIYMRIGFNPDDENESIGEVLIESDDPFDDVLTVALLGNTGEECLYVSSAGGIDFGLSSIHSTNYQTVTLQNCSDEQELDLEVIEISDDGGGVFSVDDADLPGSLPDQPKTLDPQQVTTMLVGYAPDAETQHSGELHIQSSDSLQPHVYVPLTGEGSDAECPIAEAAGSVGGALPSNPVIATNQDLVEFTSDGSTDPEGGELSYEWSIIDQPDDTPAGTAELSNPTVANPTFTVPIVGDFVIELVVYNEQGMASCQPATVEILAAPEEDVHIQLVWDAPEVDAAGGPDSHPNVQRGTDLDIHYVRPGGSWGDPDSIYYAQDGADWTGDGNQNVWLDIDDLYGEEPENINHMDPQQGAHAVGVHYYCDNGWGPADATVRIYLGDTLTEELDARLQATDYFWYVGDVVWQDNPYFDVLDHMASSHSLTSCDDFGF